MPLTFKSFFPFPCFGRPGLPWRTVEGCYTQARAGGRREWPCSLGPQDGLRPFPARLPPVPPLHGGPCPALPGPARLPPSLRSSPRHEPALGLPSPSAPRQAFPEEAGLELRCRLGSCFSQPCSPFCCAAARGEAQ